MTKKNDFLDSLDEFLNQYIVNVRGLSPKTQKSYKDSFRLILIFFYEKLHKMPDEIQFNDFSLENLNAYLQWLQEKRNCSISTRNQRLSAIRSFAKYAQIYSIDSALNLSRNVNKTPMKKGGKRKIYYFSLEELKVLLRQPNRTSIIGQRDYCILTTMYASGIRSQELCDLKVKNITFKNNEAVLDIVGKGAKYRQVTISHSPAKILKNYVRRKDRESYVFSSQTHPQMTVSCVEAIYKKYIAMARAEAPSLFPYKYSPHSMRHTCATHMLEAGVKLEVIKNILGHSSITTTQIYAEITQNKLDQELKKWNETWLTGASMPKAVKKPDEPNHMPEFLK
jgi:site-specific recombinase XerD